MHWIFKYCKWIPILFMRVVLTNIWRAMIHICVSHILSADTVWCTYGSAGSFWLFRSSRRAWNPQVNSAGLGRPFLLWQRWNRPTFFFYYLAYVSLFWISTQCTIQYAELQKGMLWKELSPSTTVNNKINAIGFVLDWGVFWDMGLSVLKLKCPEKTRSLSP